MPTREILFHIDAWGVLCVYLLMTLPFGMLAYALARRVRRWRLGQPEIRTDQMGRRIYDALRMSIFHGRTVRRRNLYGGLMHLAIFTGFVTLLIGTLIVMVEADIAVPMGRSFFHGGFYLGFKLAMNSAGLLVLVGVAMAFYRRLVLKRATQQTSADDLLVLAWLTLLVLQGYAAQALRLALAHDPWAAWSFVSYPLAAALQGIPVDAIALLQQLNWWAHYICALGFIGYVGYSKMVHPFTALANVLLRRLKPRGELDAIDFEKSEILGVSKLEHYTQPQLMSVDACLHCGRCLEYCPTFNTGKPLRPRDLVLELAGAQADSGGVFSGVLGEGANSGRFRWGAGAERTLIGEVVSEDEIWDCTTCGACMEQCPVYIEHVPLIIGLRRNLVMEQNSFPPELIPTFTSLERLGNPYQGLPADRDAWTKRLDIPVPRMADVKKSGAQVEYLFFVGCVGSFVGRSQNTVIALAKVLQAAGVSFAILGKEESCTGDPARRMGHEFLAQQLAAKTVERLNFYHVKKVVTACPHCFNALRNEYPQLGGNYDVIHHSELIAELIKSGRVSLDEASTIAQGKVTYHDPCYLGRYNGVLDDPRAILAALPGIELEEMPRNRKHSFCCGGGGGRALMKEDRGSRINVERVREAVRTGAQVVAAACPFCMGMLEDGVIGQAEQTPLRVLDIAELVAASLTAPVAAKLP